MSVPWEQIGFFRALSREDRERLRPRCTLRRLGRGETLWEEGDPSGTFAFVVSGRVKLVVGSERGRESILEIGGPGELLCASAVCAATPYCCRADAMDDTIEVVAVPREDVLALVENSGDAARAFVREITGRAEAMCRRVEELGAGQVEQRIARLLLRLAERAGETRGAEVFVAVPLTRQDLADLCGTVVETAIRVMSRLRRAGIVTSAAGGFTVHDREALARIAGIADHPPGGRVP